MAQPSAPASSIQDNDALSIYDTNMVAFVGFTVLIWDHLITVVDEVELIWRREKGLLVYLFLLNRYLTPLGFIVNLVGELCLCHKFVRYEGAMTTIGIQVAGLMMLLRVRALYKNKKAVFWSVMLVFLVWVGVNAWLLTFGEGMALYFRENNVKSMASASAWLPLIYDTLIFALVLNKTQPALHRETSGHIVRTLYADGILYYSLICAVNLVLTIMIKSAPSGVQNIAAHNFLRCEHSFHSLAKVAMMSRITLNLRKQGLYGPTPTASSVDGVIPISRDWPQLGPRQSTCARPVLAATAGTHFPRTRGGSLTLDVHPLDSPTFSNNLSVDSYSNKASAMGGSHLNSTQFAQGR
ncbi:hypothetical protein BDN67DRAFT_1029219 [Paxillus ammoniavirescens]|nr:hypothetical protein BDN67DRAFT_1029219 [Paxillus ammoniavirescens]